MNKILLTVAFACLVSACNPPDPSSMPGYGEVRERLFVQCMELAANTVREGHYNDSAEVIDECASTSYYIANSYRADGYKGASKEGVE